MSVAMFWESVLYAFMLTRIEISPLVVVGMVLQNARQRGKYERRVSDQRTDLVRTGFHAANSTGMGFGSFVGDNRNRGANDPIRSYPVINAFNRIRERAKVLIERATEPEIRELAVLIQWLASIQEANQEEQKRLHDPNPTHE